MGTEDYVCLDKDTQQGRVGALTRATARTHTDNGNAEGNPYELVQPNAFAQKQIENQTTNNETTVDIFYSAASSYRVIFDTDYTYIPRQQVDLGKKSTSQMIRNQNVRAIRLPVGATSRRVQRPTPTAPTTITSTSSWTRTILSSPSIRRR